MDGNTNFMKEFNLVQHLGTVNWRNRIKGGRSESEKCLKIKIFVAYPKIGLPKQLSLGDIGFPKVHDVQKTVLTSRFSVFSKTTR